MRVAYSREGTVAARGSGVYHSSQELSRKSWEVSQRAPHLSQGPVNLPGVVSDCREQFLNKITY